VYCVEKRTGLVSADVSGRPFTCVGLNETCVGLPFLRSVVLENKISCSVQVLCICQWTKFSRTVLSVEFDVVCIEVRLRFSVLQTETSFTVC
jgi:hypothetical protein